MVCSGSGLNIKTFNKEYKKDMLIYCACPSGHINGDNIAGNNMVTINTALEIIRHKCTRFIKLYKNSTSFNNEKSYMQKFAINTYQTIRIIRQRTVEVPKTKPIALVKKRSYEFAAKLPL